MRQLFDLPDVKPRTNIKKRDVGVVDLSGLRGQQRPATDGILSILLNTEGGCIIVLEGVAGSGKTHITSRIIESVLREKWDAKIAFSATTNAAVSVSFQSTEFYHPSLDFLTIHKLLALKEIMLEDGSLDFFPDKWATPAISEYKIVFIDESSQFSRKLWAYLLPFVDMGLKVVFIGDPFQTPPVKEADSLVFNSAVQREHHMHVFKLTEIVRQAAGNPIIGVSKFVREHMQGHNDIGRNFKYQDQLFDGDKGVQFINPGSRADAEYFDELLRHIFCSPNFKADTNFGKVVCWRNKTVRNLNKNIRRMIYGSGKLRRIEPEEKIIATKPVWGIDNDMIIVNNGTQMEVIEFSRQEEDINEGQYVLYYYDTKVRYYDMRGNEVIKCINIPTDKGVQVFNEVSGLLADHAKSFKQGTFAFKTAWMEFYKFQKTYASIQSNYASTIHLAQGRSITNSIVMACDINCNPKAVDRNKILYTGLTRAVDRLIIV